MIIFLHRYDLMIKCWSYKPEQRSSFRYCLDELLLLQQNTSDSIVITSDTLNRSSHQKNGNN